MRALPARPPSRLLAWLLAVGACMLLASCGRGTQSSASAPAAAPLPALDGPLLASVREIYRRGLALGNHPDVFAKVGDSNTASVRFLAGMGCGRARLGAHPDLQATIRFFARRRVPRGYRPLLNKIVDRQLATPCRRPNSFVRVGFAAKPGWRAAHLLTAFPPAAVVSEVGLHLYPGRVNRPGARIVPLEGRPQGVCPPEGQALACELRAIKPALAFIMIGTNDLPRTPPALFVARLRRVVAETVAAGTIPVVSTIPPALRAPLRVSRFNALIARVAHEAGVPLWDLWSSLMAPGVMNNGLTPDGVHLGYYRLDPYDLTAPALRYGANLRNLQALEILDRFRRRILTGR
jgi:GDSL-like lipase/acylhydrolase family protein